VGKSEIGLKKLIFYLDLTE